MTEPHAPAVPEVRGTPNLNKALAAFQAEMPTLERDRTVNVETKGDKPNYDYSYATLANVTAAAMPLLGKHGLSFTAFPGAGSDGKGMSLHYSLLHESGEERSGEFPMSAEGGIQILGGRITYIRRYCLLAVTGLAAEEDDDAAAAQDFDANKGTAQRRPPAPQRARKVAPAAEPEGRTAQRAARPPAPADEPPLGDGPAEPHRGKGGLITPAMTTKLAITMNEVIGNKPSDHRQFIADMVGREVATRKDLTFDEGRGLIDAFEKAKATDNPIANVIDIYRRVNVVQTATGDPASDVAPELLAAIRAADWRTVRFYANDPGGYGPNIDAARGALAGANQPERKAAERTRAAVTGTPDPDAEPPWEPAPGALLAEDGTTGAPR